MTTQPIQQPSSRATRPQSASGLERLDCYRLAVELSALTCALVPRGHGSLRDQLERASTSIVLNLAEGFGRWQARD